MNITTKEFQLTPKEHFKISTKYFLLRKSRIILFVLLVADFLFLLYLNPTDSLTLYFGIFLVLYFLILFLAYWRFSHNKENKAFYQKISFTIDKNFLNFKQEDGSEGKKNLDRIIKVVKTPNYYLLFVSKIQFLYFPSNAFKSSEDLEAFEGILKSRNLLKS